MPGNGAEHSLSGSTGELPGSIPLPLLFHKQVERQRCPPVCPALDKVPDRLAHDRAKQRGPESPEDGPEQYPGNWTEQDDARHDEVENTDRRNDTGSRAVADPHELLYPADPLRLTLKCEHRVTQKLAEHRDPQDPLYVFRIEHDACDVISNKIDLEFDSLHCLLPGLIRVLDLPHLGHQVGMLDLFGRSFAAGRDNVHPLLARLCH